MANPKYIKSVETACGSHTHTLVPGGDSVYLYVSSYSPRAEFPDCQPPHDSISIIDVPLKAPDRRPRSWRRPTSSRTVATPTPAGCHDITAYPAKKIAAGACMGDGIIMDISDPVAPKVIEPRHATPRTSRSGTRRRSTATGTKVVFTDELGGGGAATCNAEIGPTRGANGIYDLSKDNQLTFRSYYKIPRHQIDSENCVAHNGSLIPVKGRDVMVQSWYMGGTRSGTSPTRTTPARSATSSGARLARGVAAAAPGRRTSTAATSSPPTSARASTSSTSRTRA